MSILVRPNLGSQLRCRTLCSYLRPGDSREKDVRELGYCFMLCHAELLHIDEVIEATNRQMLTAPLTTRRINIGEYMDSSDSLPSPLVSSFCLYVGCTLPFNFSHCSGDRQPVNDHTFYRSSIFKRSFCMVSDTSRGPRCVAAFSGLSSHTIIRPN